MPRRRRPILPALHKPSHTGGHDQAEKLRAAEVAKAWQVQPPTVDEMRTMTMDELHEAFKARRFPAYVSWDDLLKMRGQH